MCFIVAIIGIMCRDYLEVFSLWNLLFSGGLRGRKGERYLFMHLLILFLECQVYCVTPTLDGFIAHIFVGTIIACTIRRSMHALFLIQNQYISDTCSAQNCVCFVICFKVSIYLSAYCRWLIATCKNECTLSKTLAAVHVVTCSTVL